MTKILHVVVVAALMHLTLASTAYADEASWAVTVVEVMRQDAWSCQTLNQGECVEVSGVLTPGRRIATLDDAGGCQF